MKPRVVHIGLQKAGSTSIQAFLRRNSDALRDHVHLALANDGGPTDRLGQVALRYTKTGAEDALNRFGAVLGRIRDAADRSGKPLLLSQENIMGAAFGPDLGPRPFPRVQALLSKVEETLADRPVVYALYLRNPDAWRQSMYNQMVRTASLDVQRDDFLDRTGGLTDWDDLVSRITDVIDPDRLHVRNFEEAVIGQDRPGQDLLHLAGLTKTAIKRCVPFASTANSSLNAGATEFLRQVNVAFGDTPLRRRVRDLVVEHESLFQPALHDGAKMGASK